jgi:hypothetical protein
MHYECKANPGIKMDNSTLELCRIKKCDRVVEVADDGFQSKNKCGR